MNDQAIFIAALQEDRPNRAAYLDQACGDDRELRQRVEHLLEAHDRAGSFLQQPAAEGLTEAYRPVSEGPGTVIGPYKLLQQIGEGGFGVVYMAEQQEPVRRKVALKIIKPGMDTREVIARFESERQALALMDHPNVARVFDAGATESGRPYFVMELVRGVPITEFCDKNQLPGDQRLRLFGDICHAVQHAHQKGIIHRDLKPSNILVTLHDGKPVPKVIDFGVAKATSQQLTQKTLFTAYGQMVGTPAYMSPEQAEMSGLDIDTRSDIYSLGVLLYELLTGTTPLESKRLREAGYAEMQRLIREEEPPRPSTRLTSLGGEATVMAGNRGTDVKRLKQFLRGDLDWIVMKALEKDRNRRYETPTEFAADVERFLHHEAIQARPASALYKLRKFTRRNRAATITAAGFLLLLTVGITGTTIGLVWAIRAEGESRRDAARARSAEFLADQRLTEVQTERDAANTARTKVEQTAGELKVALAQHDSHRLAAFSLANLPRNPGQGLLLAIAAAQRSPARSAAQNNVLLAALRECREERTLFAPPFNTPEGRTGHTAFVAMQVTPDGTRAVVVGQRVHDPGGDFYLSRAKDDSAQVYDLKTGNVIAAMKLPGLRFATIAISPDGTFLATGTDQGAIIRYADGQTVAYTDNAVRLWDLRTGKEIRVLKGHTDRVSSLCFDAEGKRLLSASWDRSARIWDVATGQTLHELQDGTKSLFSAEFSPDGRRVLTMTTLSDMQSDKLAESFQNRTFREKVRPDQVLIDPPVRSDAAIRWLEPLTMTNLHGTRPKAARLWDATTGKQIAVLGDEDGPPSVAGTVPFAAAFSADGARVVTAGFGKTAVWDAVNGKAVSDVRRLDDFPGKPLQDGDRILLVAHEYADRYGNARVLVWQSDKERRRWRRAAGSVVAARVGFWRGERTGPQFLAASGEGGPLIVRSSQDVVSVRDALTGDDVAVLQGHDDAVAGAAFLPGGKRLVTAAHDGTLRVWNLAVDHGPIVELKRPDGPAPGFAVVRPGAHQVLTAPPRDEFNRFSGRSLSLWDMSTGARLSDLSDDAALATSPVHKELLGDLHDLDLSPDGQRLVTVHRDANPGSGRGEEPQPSPLYTPVRVWDVGSGEQLFALKGLRRSVATARFSPDGRQILTFSDGNHIYAILREGKKYGGGSGGQLWARVDVWDAATGEHVRCIVPEAKGGGDFALWSPDGKRVLTNAQSHSGGVAADLYDAQTGNRLRELKSDRISMDRAIFSPDGKLVLGYRVHHLQKQNDVEVWDAETGERRSSLRGHTGDVTSTAFSPDGGTIMTASTDGTARIWATASGELLRVLRGHGQPVRAARFSPDGKYVVTASSDGTAQTWEAASGRKWMTLPALSGELADAQFTPDGQRVLTVSTDGVVRIWPLDPLPIAEARKPRELTADERARFEIEFKP